MFWINNIAIAYTLLLLTGCGFANFSISSLSESSVTYIVDTTPPSADSLIIASAATYTTTTSVTLELAASGSPIEMYITNTPGCTSDGTWESYTSSKSWILGQTNAVATTYVKFRDSAGNESSCISDTIVHDNTPPSMPGTFDDEMISATTSESSYAAWSSSTDSGSGLAHYEIAIGTASGGTNILGWTDIGIVNSYVRTGLSLTQGSTYYTSVKAIDNAGNTSTVALGDGWVVVPAVSVTALYSIAPNWNDYANTATPTSTCATTETNYFACLHGGEKRKVAYITAASCAGYEISDRLGAFDWTCNDSGGAGNVYFYSKGLKHTKGLADLITASAWRDNRVLISQGGTPIAGSARTAWWSNSVTPLPDSTTAGTAYNLTSTGTIYTLATSRTVTEGYKMSTGTGDKIAIVTLSGASLALSNSASALCDIDGSCLIETLGSNFNWIEGDLKGPGKSVNSFYGYRQSGKFHVVRRVKAADFSTALINGSSYMVKSFYSQIHTANNSRGIYIKGPSNIFQELTATNNSGAGIMMGDVSHNNVFQTIITTNNGSDGFYHYSNDNTFITSFTSVNNTTAGLDILNDIGGTYHNLLIQNNGSNDLFISTGTRTTFGQYAMDALMLISLSTGKFTKAWLTSASPTCFISGGTNPGLVNTTCATQGSSNFSRVTGNGTFALKGQISTDDSVNSSDTNGSSIFSSILDWFSFENLFRGWGKGGAFPSAATRGDCASGTCQIWDYRLDSTDTRFRNTTADGTNQNSAFASGGACPSYLGGNVTTVSINSTPRTYLTNAIEILGTGGNNNGLCESNETCLYTPNFGAYQGEGDYTQKWCTIGTGATIQNVTVYAY